MDRFIARENVKRFKKQLDGFDDGPQKEMLTRLLPMKLRNLGGNQSRPFA